MSNDLNPIKPTFDYAIVTQDQAMQLREIAIRLQVRVQRTAEEMLAMGAGPNSVEYVRKQLNVAKFILSEMMDSKEAA